MIILALSLVAIIPLGLIIYTTHRHDLARERTRQLEREIELKQLENQQLQLRLDLRKFGDSL